MSAVLDSAVDAPDIQRLGAAVAEDLLALALLHDRELDRDLIVRLWEHCYEDWLALRLSDQRGCEALALLRQGLTDLPTELNQETLDQLAADFADIYLTYGLRASPCESVWLDQDNLTLQEPTFQVRDYYRRHGLAVADWRKRSDDHLVNELRFLAHLLNGDSQPANLAETARFLDAHLLRWINRFAERVAKRCETRFYAGLALVTAAYLEELRDLLADPLGYPRPAPPAPVEPRVTAAELSALEAEGPYLPGVAPGW